MKTALTQARIKFEEAYEPTFVGVARTLSKNTQWKLYQLILIFTDILMIITGLKLAYAVRFELSIPVFQLEVLPYKPFYSTLMIVFVPLFLALFAIVGIYNRKNLLGGTREYALVFRATSTGLLIVIVFGFLDPTFVIARGWLLMAWILTFTLISGARFTLRRVVYALRRQGFFLSPTIIIGANEEGLSLARQLLSWETSGLHVVGFVDERIEAGQTVLGRLRALGGVDGLGTIIEEHGIEEVILASSSDSSRQNILEIFKRYGVSDGVNLSMSSGLFEIITTGLTVKEFASVPLVYVNKVRLTGLDQVLKMILEYGLTVVGLILLLPLLVLIAVIIKLDSPGPVLYRRRVMGVKGCQFDAYKFRTMHLNGDEILERNPILKEELEKNHKLKNDPRITRVGKILRKFSLDELPQLLNVLKHEMALVGPRMISPEEMKEYNQWSINLLTVRPGLTGLWQVSGRSDVSYEERIRLDMAYIRNWSIWLDMQLIINTIPAVLRSRGAY